VEIPHAPNPFICFFACLSAFSPRPRYFFGEEPNLLGNIFVKRTLDGGGGSSSRGGTPQGVTQGVTQSVKATPPARRRKPTGGEATAAPSATPPARKERPLSGRKGRTSVDGGV